MKKNLRTWIQAATKTEEETIEDTEISIGIAELLSRKIVVYNDDYNSFDHVIRTFCRILNHTENQALQCALLIHHTGRASVKEGEFDTLKPLKEALCEEGLDARIE